jgi:hypothetical protein
MHWAREYTLGRTSLRNDSFQKMEVIQDHWYILCQVDYVEC